MRYTYDGWRLAEWGAPDGTVLADYAYGNGLDELLHARWYGYNLDYYYLQDDQGSVIALADASGSVVERYGYGPGGDPIAYTPEGQPQPGGFSSPQLFAGREYDLETGLYYSRLRYYDPQAGRFITRDPLGAWADPTAWGNPYAYCGNSPWDMVDPYGLGPLELILTGQWDPSAEAWDAASDAFWYQTGAGSAASVDVALDNISFGLVHPGKWLDLYDPCDPAIQHTQAAVEICLIPIAIYTGGVAQKAVKGVITDRRLLKHLEAAVEQFGNEGFTQRQIRALSKNPKLEAAFRGERIDTFFKQLVRNDKRLERLTVTPRFKAGPDIVDSSRKVWYDVTTRGEWAKHLKRYASYGSGKPLFYR